MFFVFLNHKIYKKNLNRNYKSTKDTNNVHNNDIYGNYNAIKDTI